MHRDVWRNMQHNWDDFYWLTGETPITLQVLVNQIEHRNIFNNPLGRPGALDFRNQVGFNASRKKMFWEANLLNVVKFFPGIDDINLA